jgi:hypothetical protein
MDAKTRELALLAALSLFCAVFAWAGDRDFFNSIFFCARCSRDSRRGLWAAALKAREAAMAVFAKSWLYEGRQRRVVFVACNERTLSCHRPN